MVAYTVDTSGNIIGYSFTPSGKQTSTSSFGQPVYVPAYSGSGAILLGYWDCCGLNLNGSIANVQIYNISLTANQIQYLYNEGIGGAPIYLQYLVGWWPLNGDTIDYSGNNRNGVPTNITYNGSWASGYYH